MTHNIEIKNNNSSSSIKYNKKNDYLTSQINVKIMIILRRLEPTYKTSEISTEPKSVRGNKNKSLEDDSKLGPFDVKA